jgi:hypothetical protein
MRCTYTRYADCAICLDTFPDMPYENCRACEEARTKTGSIVSTHAGFFGSYAVVAVDDRLEKVSLTDIKIIDEKE